MNTASNETELLARARTPAGESLAELSEKSPVLLVLLRHEGCSFCRNALSDIARLRHRIEGQGCQIVLGHMGTAEAFTSFASRYGLADVPAIADPELSLYRGLGLRRGRLFQLLGPRVVWQLLKSTLAGHLPGKIKGNPFQLPGAFLIHHGAVVKAYPYRNAADRPDYLSLASPA